MNGGEELVSVRMIREDLENIPRRSLPPGYRFPWYRPGDETIWRDIQGEADKYITVSDDLFEKQFGDDPRVLGRRLCFLLDPDESAIGTAAAWFNDDYHGRCFGRVHWVAIRPHRQGKGFAKPLMTAVCTRLKALGHDCAYLTTATVRIAAINLYLKFGFVPEIETMDDLTAWRQTRDRLKGPLDLSDFERRYWPKGKS